MKEITTQDLMDARKRARQNSVATLVTGDIVESVEEKEESEEKSEE